MKLADLQKSKLDQRIEDVAFALRAIIKNVTRTNLLSSGITFDDIIDGEVRISEQLTQFCYHLVVGPDHRSHESASKIQRVEPLAADAVLSVINGRKKPSKLGLAVKSMTGSKKLIGMLNRYENCVSYTTTEELETELTFTATSASKISPPDLVPDSSLTVGIAYDNFDRLAETLSGKNTLHNTVGIVYQSVPEETS